MKGHEYFAMLNEVEQVHFEINFATCRITEDNLSVYLDDEYKHFNEFIGSAFIFSKTPEGNDYWKEIRCSQRDGIDGSESSAVNFMEKLLLLAFLSSADESEDVEPSESLEDLLKDLKIKLQDDKI
jgi:hypothetical protein